jgi:hypothetical protein
VQAELEALLSKRQLHVVQTLEQKVGVIDSESSSTAANAHTHDFLKRSEAQGQGNVQMAMGGYFLTTAVDVVSYT